MNVLEIVLSPIVWPMHWLLDLYVSLFSSLGLSILLLSFSLALLLLPLRKAAQRLEARIGLQMMTVNAELEPLKSQLKGEKLFLATEKIYQKHGYHPIKSIGMGASFFVMLPVLISAIVLFTADGVLDGVGFLIIEDLSKPDALLGAINVLPIVMSAITVADARMRFKDDIKSQYRFYLIALVLLFLVYKLPAGLVIYWTGSNILSLLLFQLQASSAPE